MFAPLLVIVFSFVFKGQSFHFVKIRTDEPYLSTVLFCFCPCLVCYP